MTAPPRFFVFLCLFFTGLVPAAAQKIRIVAGNISSGNGQDYDPGHGLRIFQGVKPDIILIQEFNYLSNRDADFKSFINLIYGNTDPDTFPFFYTREVNTGSIPNGVISRYPIMESGQWKSTVAERDYSFARIDLPGPRELLAVSVHLPTTSASVRNAEADDLVGYIEAYYLANSGARASDYLVIGGDFNTDTRTEACLSTLGAVVTIGTAHPVGRTSTSNTNTSPNTNASRQKPYDAVYAGKGLHALQTPTIIGTSTFANGLVADTRYYTPLSDLSPALVGDIAASNMQHMAIVKDFQIPLPADPPVLELLASTIKTSDPREVQLTFRSTAGATYEVQATGTMVSGAWSNLGTFTAGNTSTTITVVTTVPGAGQVRDTLLATSTRRFYRVIRR